MQYSKVVCPRQAKTQHKASKKTRQFERVQIDGHGHGHGPWPMAHGHGHGHSHGHGANLAHLCVSTVHALFLSPWSFPNKSVKKKRIQFLLPN